MERKQVVSSVVEEIGYHAPARTLEILFRSGAIYLWYFVPQDVYDGLMSADSKGAYIERHIRRLYEHHRITDPARPLPPKRAGRKPKPKGGKGC